MRMWREVRDANATANSQKDSQNVCVIQKNVCEAIFDVCVAIQWCMCSKNSDAYVVNIWCMCSKSNDVCAAI